MITVSDHAYKQARKRLRWKPDTMDRMADKAFYEGTKGLHTTGQLRDYIDRKCKLHPDVRKIRIYGQNIYFFNRAGHLVTLYMLPSQLLKHANILTNEKG